MQPQSLTTLITSCIFPTPFRSEGSFRFSETVLRTRREYIRSCHTTQMVSCGHRVYRASGFCGVGGGAGALHAKGDTGGLIGLRPGGLGRAEAFTPTSD